MVVLFVLVTFVFLMTATTQNDQMLPPKATALLKPCAPAALGLAFVNNAPFYDANTTNTPLPDLNL